MDLHQIEPQAPLLVVPLSQKWPKQSQIIFSQHFDHYHLLDIIALSFHMQFQLGHMLFNRENGRKLLSLSDNNVLFPRNGQMRIHGFLTNSWRLRLERRSNGFPVITLLASDFLHQNILSSNSTLSEPKSWLKSISQIYLKSVWPNVDQDFSKLSHSLTFCRPF